MNKILIVYASFGQGHKKAALALQSFLDSPCCDLLDYSHPFLRKIYSSGYTAASQYLPHFWQALFLAAKNNFFTFLLNKINKRIFSSFVKYIEQAKPEVIITTHFFPYNLIAGLKESHGIKLISVVTDLRAHSIWANKNVDYYFAPLEKTKSDLIAAGASAQKIISGYVPLREGFLQTLSLEGLRGKFRLDSKPCITFVSSSGGNFRFLKKSLKILLNDFYVFVIYGKNERLKNHLEKIDSPNLRLFPFYENIWELVSLSSVIITKPGGLTVFEGLYKKKPFIFTHYIPGQEKQNMDLLIKHKAARFANSAKELVDGVYYFTKNSSWISKDYPLKVKDIRFPLNSLIEKGSF